MKNILKIQEIDRQIIKLKAGVQNSKENKLLEEFTKVMKEGRNFVNNIADVSITVSFAQSGHMTDEVMEKIKKVGGVKSAELI